MCQFCDDGGERGHEPLTSPSELNDELACPGCRRLQSWARTAWNRGHTMGLESNKQQARVAMEALRKEKEAHAETNAMLTDALMKAEAEVERLKAANIQIKAGGVNRSE